jgi:hypothetical protein
MKQEFKFLQQANVYVIIIESTLGTRHEYIFSTEEKANEVADFLKRAIVDYPKHKINTNQALFATTSEEDKILYDLNYEPICEEYVASLSIPRTMQHKEIARLLHLMNNGYEFELVPKKLTIR